MQRKVSLIAFFTIYIPDHAKSDMFKKTRQQTLNNRNGLLTRPKATVYRLWFSFLSHCEQ